MTEEELAAIAAAWPSGTAVSRHRLGQGWVFGAPNGDGQIPVQFDLDPLVVDCWPVDLSLV